MATRHVPREFLDSRRGLMTASRRQPLWRIPVVVSLFLALCLAGLSSGAAHGDATITSHLYLADGPHLRHHTTDATSTLGPDSEQPIEALAVDPEHGRLFVVAGDQVTAKTLDGTVDAEWTLDDPSGDDTVLARALPLDGSVWIARGPHLEAFGPYGQALQQLELEAPVLAMDLDEVTSRLWLMTADGVELRDAIDGSLVRRLDVPDAAKPSQLAVDSVGGQAWLAVTVGRLDELWRLDGDGDVQQRHVLSGPLRHLAVDATGGLWALGESRLHRFLSETPTHALTETVLDLEPPSPDRTYQHLQPRRDGTVWLSDGRWITRLDAEGRVVERHDFGPRADLRALALIETVEADPTPQVTIRFPHEGEIVDTTRPAIALSFERLRRCGRS